jgi:hypothetical protein
MNLADFFSRGAGQRRRAWLDGRTARADEAIRHYFGPTGIPERAGGAFNLAGLFLPGADVRDAYTASDELVRSRTPADAAASGAGLAGALASLFLPGNLTTMRQGFDDLVDAGVSAHRSGALHSFAGPKAQTADHAALARAQEMTAAAQPRDVIFRETGWFRGPDGRWRFEIDDSAAALDLMPAQRPGGRPAHGWLGNVLQHDSLLGAYPDLGRVSVYHGDLGPKIRGQFVGRVGNPRDPAYITVSPRSEDPLATLLHETQHAIQQIEGFARGGTVQPVPRGRPAPNLEAYRRLADEVEARNVEARVPMPMDLRREFPPWMTQDTGDARQILRTSPGGGSDDARSLSAVLSRMLGQPARVPRQPAEAAGAVLPR